jgi:hypothetical protein
MGAIGCIDCTAHLRTRVHPRQVEWYHHDKGLFFGITVLMHFLGFNILAQVIVGYDYTIFQVTLHMGHNNDPGAFNISGVCSFVEEQNTKLLADGGTFFCSFT